MEWYRFLGITDTHAPVSISIRACRELRLSFIQVCSVLLLNFGLIDDVGVVFRRVVAPASSA